MSSQALFWRYHTVSNGAARTTVRAAQLLSPRLGMGYIGDGTVPIHELGANIVCTRKRKVDVSNV